MLTDADKFYIDQHKTLPIKELVTALKKPESEITKYINGLPKDPKVKLTQKGMTIMTQQTSERIEELNKINKDNTEKGKPEWMFRPR